MATLIVGVGGLGRGVCNWLKYRLEHEYGSPAEAGFDLLVIDGPVEDTQYVLPGGYQIDTSPHSSEFYGLTELPGPSIKAVAAGQSYPYIDRWLTKAEAQRIKDPDRIIPSRGYGQIRPASRAGFFLEADDIGRLLNMRVAGKDCIILVGSQSGGTGSGMLLDIAQVIRGAKPANTPFHAYIVLPSGFTGVFEDGQSREEGNARGFAGMRELERQRLAPNRVDYCSGVSVSNEALFSGCYLIDGEGPAGSSLSGQKPVFGVAPAIADHIWCIYGATIAATETANWEKDSVITLDGVPSEPGYWSAGVFTYLYDPKAVETNFALRFARDVYDALLTVAPAEENRGRELAEAVLRTTGPGSLAMELALKGGLRTGWPELNQPDSLIGLLTFRNSLNTHGAESTPGPRPPYAQVIDWVELNGFWRKVENDDVISQCSAFTRHHVGAPTDIPNPDPDATLWAWLNYQRRIVCREFVAQLCAQLEELFWDPHQHEWRSLEERPYTLVIARDLLKQCRDLLRAEYDHVLGVLKKFADMHVMARADDYRKKAAEQLQNEPRNAANQRVYVEGAAQWTEELSEWHALATGYESVLRDMIELTDDLWTKIGAPADGWLGYLENVCRKEVDDAYNADLTDRKMMIDSVLARRMVPKPGGLAESHLYNQVVTEAEHRATLLKQLKWEFGSTLKQPGVAFDPTVDAGDIASSFDCYLTVPQVPGYDRPDGHEVGLFDGVTGGYRDTLVHRHRPELFVQFSRNNAGPVLRGLDIWAILALEADVAGRTPQDYATEIQNDLIKLSVRSLSVVGSASETQETFGITHHRTDSQISNSVAAAMNANNVRAIALSGSTPFKYSVAVATTTVRMTLSQWAYYPTTRDHYYKRRRQLPVHCFSEERNATEYVEEFILGNHKAQVSDMPLHHSVCRHLADWQTFKAFAVCYGLLGAAAPSELPLRDTGGGSATRKLQVANCPTASGPTGVCDLGLACNMDGVLRRLMGPEPIAESARTVLRDYCSGLINAIQADSDLEQAVRQATDITEPSDIQLPQENAEEPEQLHRGHLQWALWAAVWQYRMGDLGL